MLLYVVIWNKIYIILNLGCITVLFILFKRLIHGEWCLHFFILLLRLLSY